MSGNSRNSPWFLFIEASDTVSLKRSTKEVLVVSRIFTKNLNTFKFWIEGAILERKTLHCC